MSEDAEQPAVVPREHSIHEPLDYERFWATRHEGRKRTIIMSMICSGMVSWFFAYAINTSQLHQNRRTCNLIQVDRKDRAKTVLDNAKRLERGADQVLGSRKNHVKPFNFSGTGFEKFKPLIEIQARKDRSEANQNFARNKQILGRVQNCKKVVKKPNIIPFI